MGPCSVLPGSHLGSLYQDAIVWACCDGNSCRTGDGLRGHWEEARPYDLFTTLWGRPVWVVSGEHVAVMKRRRMDTSWCLGIICVWLLCGLRSQLSLECATRNTRFGAFWVVSGSNGVNMCLNFLHTVRAHFLYSHIYVLYVYIYT